MYFASGDLATPSELPHLPELVYKKDIAELPKFMYKESQYIYYDHEPTA